MIFNDYNPVGAGAELEEAVNQQPPGSPAMPANSRPLDDASGFIAAINAMPPDRQRLRGPGKSKALAATKLRRDRPR